MTLLPTTAAALTKVYHYNIFDNMRRTTFQPGPLVDRLAPLAATWGLRPGAGPGEGHATIIRLALRTVAQTLPDVTIPRDLLRLREGGSRHTVLLEAADDAAIARICTAYELKSTAAAIRVALWIVDQYGLGVGGSAQSIQTQKNTEGGP